MAAATCWQSDLDRQHVLRSMLNNGARLAEAEEGHRHDPDIALAAVASCADAAQHVGRNLCGNRAWVLEAVRRNWEVLEFVPEAWRRDRTVVLAAARQNPHALRLVPKDLQEDPLLHAKLEADEDATEIPSYRGECLRLVGDFNMWRTTDAATRFKKLRPSELSAGQGPASAAPAQRAVRHRLLLHLLDGWVAFQVLSCEQEFSFRVYPSTDGAAKAEPFRLARDDPGGTPAAVGAELDGLDSSFYIQEKSGTTVCIYAEVARGTGEDRAGAGGVAGTGRGAAVWYVVERRPSDWQELVVLRQPAIPMTGPRWVPHWMPKLAPKPRRKRTPRDAAPPHFAVGLRDAGVELCVRAEARPGLCQLVTQVFAMSKESFEPSDAVVGVAHNHHLTLLADVSLATTLAYCLFTHRAREQSLWIHQLAVLDSHRGRGFGTVLVYWAIEQAKLAGLGTVRLHSLEAAQDFYRALGFRSMERVTSAERACADACCVYPMELTVPQG